MLYQVLLVPNRNIPAISDWYGLRNTLQAVASAKGLEFTFQIDLIDNPAALTIPVFFSASNRIFRDKDAPGQATASGVSVREGSQIQSPFKPCVVYLFPNNFLAKAMSQDTLTGLTIKAIYHELGHSVAGLTDVADPSDLMCGKLNPHSWDFTKQQIDAFKRFV